MTRSSRNRIHRRNAQSSEKSAKMGATTSINEIKPSEVHMDSKHIDKIIRMPAEIDRDDMRENARAHTELGNQFSSLLFIVAVRLVRREPYVVISSDQNILSCFKFLAERISNATDVSVRVFRDDPQKKNRYLLTPKEPYNPGAIAVLDLDHPDKFVTYEATHALAYDDNYHVDRIIGLAKEGACDFGADHKTMPNEKERLKRSLTPEHAVLLNFASVLLQRRLCVVFSTNDRAIDLFMTLAGHMQSLTGVEVRPFGYPLESPDKKHWLFLPEGASDKDELVFFDIENQPLRTPCKVDHKPWIYTNLPSELFAFSKEREAERNARRAVAADQPEDAGRPPRPSKQ
jgi:hypothetical protein